MDNKNQEKPVEQQPKAETGVWEKNQRKMRTIIKTEQTKMAGKTKGKK